MSALDQNLDDYLRLRRSLGHDLADAARLLPRFVAYLDAAGVPTVTVAAAMEWALQPDAQPGTTVWSRRMTWARGFARYMAAIDPATEVPPAGLLPYRRRWRPPFIYTPGDIAALMAEAGRLQSPLKAATFETLIGLLAATGMRVGEAVRLDRSDIDWIHGVLLIRESKFAKTRQVPVQPSTLDALGAYTRKRDEFWPDPAEPSFFLSLKGERVKYKAILPTFRQLCNTTGIGGRSPRPPRIHDLRHAFAVHTLLEWYRNGVNVQARLPWLSTYLGHRDPRSTYWYLSAAPELLAFAAVLLENDQEVTVR
jgi:integrase